jgi:hypothetical protein
MRKEIFINDYLSEAIVRRYEDISMEQEAKRYEKWAFSILGTPNLCSQQPSTQPVTPVTPEEPRQCPSGQKLCDDRCIPMGKLCQ